MTLEVKIFDVQHGSSAYIKTPNNKHILHDLGCGSYNNGDEFSPIHYVKNILNRQGIERLDKVIITHPHKDHIDDILNFMDVHPRVLHRPHSITREKVMEGVRDEDKAIFDEYCRIAYDLYTSPVSSEEDLQIPTNAGGVKIRTFFPRSCSTSDLNSHSGVTIVSYADSKIMLTGDNNSCSWNELLKDEEFITAIKGTDIFLTPHHGRESGWHKGLFDHFTPQLTITSDGKYSDTSTDRYSEISSGWEVLRRTTGQYVERKCLTTRNDGVINVKLFKKDNKPYMHVNIN